MIDLFVFFNRSYRCYNSKQEEKISKVDRGI